MVKHTYRNAGSRDRTAALASLVVLALTAAGLAQLDKQQHSARSEIVVYCAVALRKPVEAAAAAYTAQSGTPIRLECGASGELAGKLDLDRRFDSTPAADLYIPADASFAVQTAAKGLTSETWTLAQLRLVLAHTPRLESPPDTIERLLDSKLDYAVCDRTAGAGHATALALAERYADLESSAKTTYPRVTEAAGAVASSQALDAAIVWEATARQFRLAITRMAELDGATSTVTANLVVNSPSSDGARAFAAFLATAPASRRAFADHGFAPPDPQSP